MLNYGVYKNIYYNQKSINSDTKIDNNFPAKYNKKIQRVDVNILLNRVQLNKKNEYKKKLLFIMISFLIIAGTGFLMLFSN
jgi:hypothetical protein